MFSKMSTSTSTKRYSDDAQGLSRAIKDADAIIVGAGSGLSAAAGHSYTGERFMRHFSDFHEKYGLTDIYSGGFYPFETDEESYAWWSRHIYVNRYLEQDREVYKKLHRIVSKKPHYVLTTNVDHLFFDNGFDDELVFPTQGDYGLFQCCVPCHDVLYPNRTWVENMMREQKDMKVDASLIPRCPKCGEKLVPNLRKDKTFVEDDKWRTNRKNCEAFFEKYKATKILYLELGIGYNTPKIIKYPFWRLTHSHDDAVYACINLDDAHCPEEIINNAILIEGDITKTIDLILE